VPHSLHLDQAVVPGRLSGLTVPRSEVGNGMAAGGYPLTVTSSEEDRATHVDSQSACHIAIP
jgi:hypothetical protein